MTDPLFYFGIACFVLAVGIGVWDFYVEVREHDRTKAAFADEKEAHAITIDRLLAEQTAHLGTQRALDIEFSKLTTTIAKLGNATAQLNRLKRKQ